MAMLLTPLVLPAGLTVDGIVVGPQRYGIPTLYALAGSEPGTGERVEIVGFEWPEDYPPLPGTSAHRKRLNEERQIARLRADFKAGWLPDPFVEVAGGRDPPDFVCETESRGMIGVEVTQLTLGDRAEDHQLFLRLKQRVLGVEVRFPGQFHRLQGHIVAASFRDAHGKSTKPARIGQELPFIRALQQFHSDPSSPPTTVPDKADPRDIVEFSGGSISAARLSGHPPTTFYRMMQFELINTPSTSIRHSDAWDQFETRLRDHDQLGVDVLVVAAGSPTASGVAHPVDTMLARAVVARAAQRTFGTTHIKRVWIHSWPERAIYELIPGQLGGRLLCGTAFDLQPV